MELFPKDKPKIKLRDENSPEMEGWISCPKCSELVFQGDLNDNLNCCTYCNHHFLMSAKGRIASLTDSFEEFFTDLVPIDPLKFVDKEPYTARLERAAKKGGHEAIICGKCTIEKQDCALGVMDFSFMGGSMGAVAGEKIAQTMELALEKKIP